jgi:ribonuclease P protein component
MRNQLKRRLRELARVRLVPLMIRVDVVMRIRPDAYEATFSALAKDIARVLEQLEQWGVPSQESSVSSEPRIETPGKTS